MTASVVGYMMRTALHNNRKLQEGRRQKNTQGKHARVNSPFRHFSLNPRFLQIICCYKLWCWLFFGQGTALFQFNPDFTFTLVLRAPPAQLQVPAVELCTAPLQRLGCVTCSRASCHQVAENVAQTCGGNGEKKHYIARGTCCWHQNTAILIVLWMTLWPLTSWAFCHSEALYLVI